jgi:hypothetical protein
LASGLAEIVTAAQRPSLPSLRSIVPTLIVDGACPYVVYVLMRRYVPSTSEVLALGLGALFPIARGIVEVRQRRNVDIIGAIVIVGIAVSLVALSAGGSARLFLIRESFVTAALGLLALTSFAWPRPLLFYISRQFTAGHDPAALEQFNGLWQQPVARRTFRLMTLVWAVGWLGEFALRVVMVLTLSVAQVLAISPFVFNGVTVGLVAWTLAYARRQRQRGETLRSREAAGAGHSDGR